MNYIGYVIVLCLLLSVRGNYSARKNPGPTSRCFQKMDERKQTWPHRSIEKHTLQCLRWLSKSILILGSRGIRWICTYPKSTKLHYAKLFSIRGDILSLENYAAKHWASPALALVGCKYRAFKSYNTCTQESRSSGPSFCICSKLSQSSKRAKHFMLPCYGDHESNTKEQRTVRFSSLIGLAGVARDSEDPVIVQSRDCLIYADSYGCCWNLRSL